MLRTCKNQELIQSSTTPDQGYQWESDRLTVDTTNESQEVSPFPAVPKKYFRTVLAAIVRLSVLTQRVISAKGGPRLCRVCTLNHICMLGDLLENDR